jgi:hypothetical protein
MRKILYVDWEGKEISEFLPSTLLEVKDENTNETRRHAFEGFTTEGLGVRDAKILASFA